MDVALRRLRAEDISQVIEIEREAFSPLWSGTPFKREVNNRYARYLVAHFSQDSDNADAIPSGDETADASLWGRMVKTVQEVVKREPARAKSDSNIVGYVGVWFQGNEAHNRRRATSITLQLLDGLQ